MVMRGASSAVLLFLLVPSLSAVEPFVEDACSAEGGAEAKSQHLLLQARLQPASQLREEKPVLLSEEDPCSAMAYCNTGTNVEATHGKSCGPYKSESFEDTCDCIDTIKINKGCGFEVATEKKGKGKTKKYHGDGAMAEGGGLGYDRVRSIRVFKKPATAPAPTLGCGCNCKPGYCMIWGDPHFLTFDGLVRKFTWKQIFWIVKSPTVRIQGRATKHAGQFIGFGASGPWLDNNKLVVNSGKVFWNDEEILKGKDDEFIKPGLVDLQRHRKPLSSEDHMKDLPEKTKENGEFKNKIGRFNRDHYIFKLPNHVEMIWVPEDYHTMFIKMPAAPPQSGWCGNFNGNEDDEPKDMDREFKSAEDLGPVSKEDALWEVDEGLVERAPQKDWDGEPCEKGKEACEPVKSDPMLYDSCMCDVCSTDDPNMANSSMAAEAMETEEVRSIPEKLGHGRCLDGEGKQYTAFEETKENHEPDCVSELRDMASTEGVRGVQRAKGGRCQILVEPELVSMMSQTFSKVSDGEGTKMVESVTKEEGWECWRLN